MKNSMKYEKPNHKNLIKQPSNFLGKVSTIRSLIITPQKYIYLLLCVFCFSSLTNKRVVSREQQEIQLTKFSTIEDPYERAISWSIYTYTRSLNHPQTIDQQLAIGETLWANDFVLKKAILLLTKAEIAKVHGAYDQTTSNVLKAIKIFEAKQKPSLAEKKLLSLAYVTFARFSKYTKDKEGLSYAYKGLELATSINFPTGCVFAHNQIGLLIGYSRKEYKVALDHFMQAKNLLAALPEEVYQFINGFIIGNIAKAWSDLGNIEKSIAYKLKILETNNLSLELLLGTHNNLGSNYYALKQYDLAEEHLQKTLDLMKEHQVFTNKGIPLLRMGLIQLEKGNTVGALVYADAIDYWLIGHKFLGNYKVSFYQFKSRIAKKRKDYEQAIFWIDKASTEQDSIDKIAGFNNLIKLEESAKFREIKQEQLLLEKELALNKSIIDSQNITLLAISFITILSIWFSISFYAKTKELREAYNFILQKNSTSPITTTPLIIEKSTKNSSVSKTIDEALKQKIIDELEVQKIYLLPDLTLRKFASHLSSNTSYVSQTINEGFGKNFSSLINEYRVKEVLLFFEEGLHQQFTIESLYKKAGFKSKSVFQKAFKASTGVTASHYLAHIS